MFVCLLPAELRRGWGQEDNVGLQVGLVDAGQGAGLEVENTNLPGIDDGSYAEIWRELLDPLSTDRHTIVAWLQSRHEIFSSLASGVAAMLSW